MFHDSYIYEQAYSESTSHSCLRIRTFVSADIFFDLTVAHDIADNYFFHKTLSSLGLHITTLVNFQITSAWSFSVSFINYHSFPCSLCISNFQGFILWPFQYYSLYFPWAILYGYIHPLTKLLLLYLLYANGSQFYIAWALGYRFIHLLNIFPDCSGLTSHSRSKMKRFLLWCYSLLFIFPYFDEWNHDIIWSPPPKFLMLKL